MWRTFLVRLGFFYDWIHRRAIPFTRHYRSAATALWVGWAGGRAALVICIARPAICIRFARRWGVGFFFFLPFVGQCRSERRDLHGVVVFFLFYRPNFCASAFHPSRNWPTRRTREDEWIRALSIFVSGGFFFLGHRVRSTSIWTPMMDGRSFPTGSLRFNETNGVSSNGSGSRRSDRVGLAYWVSTGFLLSFFFYLIR